MAENRDVAIVIMSVEDFRDWHQQRRGVRNEGVVRDGFAPFAYVADKGFRWTCPDCGQPFMARTGAEPISGWDNPQWVLTGPPESPSATPSLGCGLMKTEPGHHWWLRDGRMVAA